MSIAQGRIDGLIDRIHEAGLSPDLWGEVLAETGQMIGATSGSVLWVDGLGLNLLRVEAWNLDPEVWTTFQRDYIAVCPRMIMALMSKAGDVYDDHKGRALARKRGMVRDYYDFLDRNEAGQSRHLIAECSPDLRIGLNFYRPNHRESRKDDEERLLMALAPHIRRASNLTLRLTETAERSDLEEALFELSSAMLLLDSSGRVRRMNRRAEAMFALSDGLRLVRGFVHAARSADDLKLTREIRSALTPGEAGSPSPDGLALVARPSGRPAWAVSVVPLPARHRRGLVKPSPHALMTIVETVPRVRPAQVRRLFGLSAAEAQIAAVLVAGNSLEDIAEARGATLGTVRVQLKGIFAKLEVSSQAELVGRISASLGALRPLDPE